VTIVDSDAAGAAGAAGAGEAAEAARAAGAAEAAAAVVREYLGRLHAAGWGLQPARREELVAEVSEHISEALRAERAAGNGGEVVVRNVLERLGPPEDIVRAETEPHQYEPHQHGPDRYGAAGAPPTGYPPVGALGTQVGPATAYARPSVWGPVEIVAVLLLSVGGLVLPIVGPLAGIVFVWVSDRWTGRQKIVGTLLGLLPVLWLPVAVFGIRF
jgi:hypothetical protein